MRLFWHELKGELLLYTRSRELAFFTFLLPMIFFLPFVLLTSMLPCCGAAGSNTATRRSSDVDVLPFASVTTTCSHAKRSSEWRVQQLEQLPELPKPTEIARAHGTQCQYDG